MNRILHVSALCLALSGAAFADERVDALAQQYVELPEVQKMMKDMFAPEAMATQFQASLPPTVELSAEQTARVGELLSEAMSSLQPAMEDAMIAGSAKHFTAEELEAMIEFYSSEIGGSVLAKTQPFMADTMATMGPLIQKEMASATPELTKIIMGE